MSTTHQIKPGQVYRHRSTDKIIRIEKVIWRERKRLKQKPGWYAECSEKPPTGFPEILPFGDIIAGYDLVVEDNTVRLGPC